MYSMLINLRKIKNSRFNKVILKKFIRKFHNNQLKITKIKFQPIFQMLFDRSWKMRNNSRDKI